MKVNFPLVPAAPSATGGATARSRRAYPGYSLIAGGCLAMAAIAAASPGLAVPTSASEPIAQALPTPLPPLPSAGSPAATGEQFLVLVNGNSDLLLQQVRQIEPGAFVNYVDGRSVIQAGRFNSFQNAQIRADELAILGIGAEVQSASAMGTPIAVTAASNYDLSFPPPATSTVTPLPPNTVAAAPASIEFGQAAPFQTTAAPATSTFPPTSSAFPTNSLPATSSPNIVNGIPSGYYVVIPGSTSELADLANRVISLGAPASLVYTRTAPRGPHIAIGPYQDRGIAQEWSYFLIDSGIRSARVHFE